MQRTRNNYKNVIDYEIIVCYTYNRKGGKMKGFLKFIGGIFFVLYLIVVIILTVFLLNYNDYNITVLGNKSYIPLTEQNLGEYQKGDLLVVEKVSNDDININDMIFFYETDMAKKTVNINYGRVINKRKISDTETTFTMDGNVEFSSEYVIGSSKNTKVYSGLGTLLAYLESRWIFLLVVVLPILFIFLYEIYAIIQEVKKQLKK